MVDEDKVEIVHPFSSYRRRFSKVSNGVIPEVALFCIPPGVVCIEVSDDVGLQ